MDPVWNSVHRERAELIRDLRDLGPHDWDVESACRGWRIRDVVAHLVGGPRGVGGLVHGRRLSLFVSGPGWSGR